MKNMEALQGKFLMMGKKLGLPDEAIEAIKQGFEMSGPEVKVVKVTTKEAPVDIAEKHEDKMPSPEDVAQMTEDDAKALLLKMLAKYAKKMGDKERKMEDDGYDLSSMVKKRMMY